MECFSRRYKRSPRQISESYIKDFMLRLKPDNIEISKVKIKVEQPKGRKGFLHFQFHVSSEPLMDFGRDLKKWFEC